MTIQGTLSGTEQRQPRGDPAGQRRSPSRRASSERRQPRADDRHRRLLASRCSARQRATQFRVVTTTNPPVISPVAGRERRRAASSSHVARTQRRGFARIYGTVTPAENGAQVGILRIVRGHGVLVGGTVLQPHGTTSSTLQPRRPCAPGGLPRARARGRRRADLQLRPAAADPLGAAHMCAPPGAAHAPLRRPGACAGRFSSSYSATQRQAALGPTPGPPSAPRRGAGAAFRARSPGAGSARCPRRAA